MVSVEIQDMKGASLKKYYSTGDFFGESIVLDEKVWPSLIMKTHVVAITTVEIVTVNKILFMDLIYGTDVCVTMQRVSESNYC